MHLSVIYGMMLAVVLMLTWGSHNHVIQKLGFLMALSWALSNVAVVALGFHDAPLIVPSINAVIAIVVGALGFSNRNYTCTAVFALFGAEIAITVWAYISRHNGEWIHYAALNAVFTLRMLIVGGSAVSDLARWVDREHPRASIGRAGR